MRKQIAATGSEGTRKDVDGETHLVVSRAYRYPSVGGCDCGGLPQNSWNIPAEKGLADFNQRIGWVQSYDYELPLGCGHRFGGGKRASDLILGGRKAQRAWPAAARLSEVLRSVPKSHRLRHGCDSARRQVPPAVFGDALSQIYFRFLETDECFDYAPAPVPPQGRWRISGIDLPDNILRKVYQENAARLLKVSL